MTWGIRFSNARREGNELVVHVRMTRLRAMFEAARWLREFSRGEPLRVQFAMVAAFAMYATKHAAKWVALAVVVALALSGCRMPAPNGCTPGARRCHEDTPQVCSPGQRWTPADVTCSTVGASCIVRDGVPACLRGEQ